MKLELVVMVYWLVTGQPAYDYVPRPLCEHVRGMMRAGETVELYLQDGSILRASRVECRPVLAVDIGVIND